jgi:hypothetical protein
MLGTTANEELKSKSSRGDDRSQQTCQQTALSEVQFLQIDASSNPIDVWNAQQKSVIIMG